MVFHQAIWQLFSSHPAIVKIHFHQIAVSIGTNTSSIHRLLPKKYIFIYSFIIYFGWCLPSSVSSSWYFAAPEAKLFKELNKPLILLSEPPTCPPHFSLFYLQFYSLPFNFQLIISSLLSSLLQLIQFLHFSFYKL